MSGTLYIGTSGYAYPEWKGAFYPEDLKNDAMLAFYSERFPSVEINYTFRRFPAEKTLQRWAGQAPPGFRFAMKANSRITHTKRLRDAEADVSDFLQRSKLLGEHQGPILFQCPPSLQFDRGLIESFLAYLPPLAPYTFEFRHESWSAARELLAENGAAWCLAETDEVAVDRTRIPPGPFGYLRLRQETYTDKELSMWAVSIRSALDDGRDVYVYLKHEEGGAAPEHAERLRALMS